MKNNLALEIIKIEACAKISRAKYNFTPLKAILAWTDLLIYSFIQLIFTEHLPCADYVLGTLDTAKHRPCPQGGSSPEAGNSNPPNIYNLSVCDKTTEESLSK